MAQESESRLLDKVIIRLPDGMRERIKTAADFNNRSMNAEIVAALEERFPSHDAFDLEKFHSEFLAPIILETDTNERERIILKANVYLAKQGYNRRIRADETEDTIRYYLVVDGVELKFSEFSKAAIQAAAEEAPPRRSSRKTRGRNRPR